MSFRSHFFISAMLSFAVFLSGCASAPGKMPDPAEQKNSEPGQALREANPAQKAACIKKSQAYMIAYDFKADGFEREQLIAMMDAHQEKTAEQENLESIKAKTHEIINDVYSHPNISRKEWYDGIYGLCLIGK